MREFVIKENDANQRLDKYITKSFKLLPKNLLYKYVRLKKIKVNRKRCEINQILQVDDTIQMYISEEFFDDVKSSDYLKSDDLKEIVYEDQNLLVVNKPIGLAVHSNASESIQTVSNQVLKYLVQTKQYDPQNERSFTPACVNRLDTNTTGLVIACKNASALRFMNEKIRNHEVNKHYYCIIEGSIPDGCYEHYYRKNEKENIAEIFDTPQENTVLVSLVVKTVKKGKKYSCCDVLLITGKSHQIRAQFAHLGHPLLGDKKYGGNTKVRHFQALSAYKLEFQFKDCDEMFAYLNHQVIQQVNPLLLRDFEKYEQKI